jgi:hypothetical protein
MKKMLLIALALGIGFSSFAQNQKKNLGVHRNLPYGIKQKVVADPNVATSSATKHARPITSRVKGPKAGLNQIQFASSGNILTVEFPQYTSLSSNPGLNLVAFTHRGGGIYGSTSNNINVTYTSNNGVGFDSVYLGILTSWNNRYPSGVILNPTGNSDPTKAYLGYGGSFWTGSSDWLGHYLGSERLDATNSHINYFKWDDTPLQISPINLASCSDNSVHCFDPYYLTATSDGSYVTPPLYTESTNGTFVTGAGTDSLHWDTTHFNTYFMTVPNDSPGVYMFNWGSAWSEDGSIGYIYFFGVDSMTNYNYSVQPIVYKSTNKGKTWTEQPIFDFSTISTIQDSLRAVDNDSTLVIPHFGGSDEPEASVDCYGNLHIVTVIQGQSSSSPDSAAYTYTGDVQRLYDVYMTPTGGWDAHYITAIQSAIVAYTDPAALVYSGGNNVGWDHRIHVTRTADGRKMFATWMDVSDVTSTPEITLPDLIGYGWDNTNNFQTPVKNFTHNTAYDGTCFWKYAADRALTNGTTGTMNYNIPITTTIPNSDGTATDPCVHYYMTGIFFNDTNFTGVLDTTKAPVVTLPKDTGFCTGGSLTLDAGLSATGFTYHYAWKTKKHPATFATTETITIDSAATYIVTVNNGYHANTTDTVVVTAFANPVNIISRYDTSCNRLTLNPGAGYASYYWSTNATTPTLDVSSTGIYWVDISNNHGCTTRDSANVKIYPLTTAYAGVNQSICKLDTLTIANDSAANYNSLLWTTSGDGHFLGNTTINPKYVLGTTDINNGTVDLTLTAFGHCDTIVTTFTLTITASTVATAGTDTTVCPNSPVQLTSAGGTTYSWSPATGLSSTTIANPVATPTATTTYTVNVGSSCGSATAGVTITVTPSTTPVISGNDTLTSSIATGNQWYKNSVIISGATHQTYIIPANGGGNYYDVVTETCGKDTSNTIKNTLGINELSNNCNINIYPNPFHGTTSISVSLIKTSEVAISITDLLGRNVYEINNGSVDAGTHTYTFDGSKLQSGIYFFTVKAGENSVTHKMIVE